MIIVSGPNQPPLSWNHTGPKRLVRVRSRLGGWAVHRPRMYFVTAPFVVITIVPSPPYTNSGSPVS
jgi:hypothetical protein